MRTGENFTCNCIGMDEKDVIMDLFFQVGNVNVSSIYYVSDIHRITGTVRKGIIEQCLMNERSKKSGRPRKYDLVGG
jgi:hypothetical protein